MMKKVNHDMSNWQAFPLSKLFLVTYGNKFDYNKMVESEDMDIAFVSRTASNNGVSGWVEPVEGVEPYPANCITIALGGSIGSTFVQPKKFYTGQNVAVLKDLKERKMLSVEEKLFISMLITKECNFRYVAFGRELNKHIKKDFTIRLPSKNDDINWEELEILSKGILKEVQVVTSNVLSDFSSIKEWKKFKVKDLFFTTTKGKLPRGKVHSKDALLEGDEFFYVGAKKRNNGIMYRCGYCKEQISKGNCIVFICNGQGSVGYTNYMDVDFMASGDVALGYNEYLNKYNALFLVTLFDKERFKYSFGRKWGKYLAETEIPLPVTPEGFPDWKYMESYIKSLPYGDVL